MKPRHAEDGAEAPLQSWLTAEPGVVLLRLRGVADMRAHADLRELLEELQQQVLASGASEIRVDFRELEFMNSSCLAEFVRWLEALPPPPRVCRVVFRANHAHTWQKRSLHALSCMALDVVQLES